MPGEILFCLAETGKFVKEGELLAAPQVAFAKTVYDFRSVIKTRHRKNVEENESERVERTEIERLLCVGSDMSTSYCYISALGEPNEHAHRANATALADLCGDSLQWYEDEELLQEVEHPFISNTAKNIVFTGGPVHTNDHYYGHVLPDVLPARFVQYSDGWVVEADGRASVPRYGADGRLLTDYHLITRVEKPSPQFGGGRGLITNFAATRGIGTAVAGHITRNPELRRVLLDTNLERRNFQMLYRIEFKGGPGEEKMDYVKPAWSRARLLD